MEKAKRFRKGDYVKNPKLVGRVVNPVDENSVLVADRFGNEVKLTKSELYKATKEEYLATPDPGTKPQVKLKPNWSKYTKHKDVKTTTGRPTVDNNDTVAELLRGKGLAEVYKEVATHSGLEPSRLKDRYAHLNPGMQRMCLGNKLRNILNKQEESHVS